MACKECDQAIGLNEGRKIGLTQAAWKRLRYHKKTCPHYKGKDKADVQKPVMPSFVVDEHRKIGKAKVEASMVHLDAAAEALDAACRDLCSVINANRLYRDIAKLSNQTREMRREVSMALTVHEIDFALDREPNEDDRTNVHLHGCGMEAEAGS